MDSQSDKASSQASSSRGMSFSGFSFQKKVSQSRVKLEAGAGLGGGGDGERARGRAVDEGKDYVLSLEGKTIHSTKPKPKEKEYVVAFIGKNRWRLPPGSDQTTAAQPSSSSSSLGPSGGQGKTEEELRLDREAAEAVLNDIQEAQIRGSGGGDEAGGGLVVPLLLQNAPPILEGRKDDELADLELRPEQSTMDDYEEMPIEKFGEAVLKGMGWKKGEAIGRTNKGLIEPIEFIPRIGGLGLGATPRAPPPEKKDWIKKPGEEPKKVLGPYIDKDGRVKHVKKIGEEIPQQPLQGFIAGNYARVLSGPHKGLQGKIVSVDDDTARVVLRMAINSQLMTFSQHHLEWLSKEAYASGGRGSGRSSEPRSLPQPTQSEKSEKKYGLVTKEDRLREKQAKLNSEKRTTHRRENDELPALMPSSKRLKHSEEEESSSVARDKRHRTQDRSLEHHKSKRDDDRKSLKNEPQKHVDNDKKSSKKKKSKEKRTDEVTRETNWLSSNLRVRIVDQDYKKGKFYNSKVVVVDVVSLGTCVCQTDSGKLLEGVTQSMLETVVPKGSNAAVMLVGRKRKGQLARIIKQERSRAEAVVELVLSKEVLSVHFDDICEYVGDVEEMDM